MHVLLIAASRLEQTGWTLLIKWKSTRHHNCQGELPRALVVLHWLACTLVPRVKILHKKWNLSKRRIQWLASIWLNKRLARGVGGTRGKGADRRRIGGKGENRQGKINWNGIIEVERYGGQF